VNKMIITRRLRWRCLSATGCGCTGLKNVATIGIYSAKGDRSAAVQALDQAERVARSIGHDPDLARIIALRGQILENVSPADENRDKTTSKPSSPDALTTRELEILRLIQAGFSNQQIAEKLFLTTGTVKLHIHHIYSKLDAGSRTKALSRGHELGLL
jgi:ATP/maltotriose-dependent transcriptional regulator MalT